MANLLYAEYNTGCSVFWNLSSNVPTDYHYGMSASRACYYADLEPNTTYTIQAVDSTDVFRIALTSQDLKYLHATSDTVVSNPFSWGYRADNSTPVTFTTGSNNIHLVAIYTTTSQYNIRVMLNEGSSIEPYEAPTRYFKDHWHLINGELVYDGMPEPIENNLTPPYPASMWRLDSDNDLVTLLFPEPLANFTPPYPASMWYVDVDDDLENALLPEPTPKAFMYPYPASLWYLEDEDLILLNIFLPDEILIPPEPEGGAFYNAESLEYVKIPRTVTSIGVESFKGTKLKKVCISRNCKYYNTSFPSDCEVIFYEDMYDENYRIVVSGKHSYRYTETVTHLEDSVSQENP